MTRRLECFIEGCDAAIEGESDEEILTQAGEHAAKAHPDLELDDDVVEQLKAHIVTV